MARLGPLNAMEKCLEEIAGKSVTSKIMENSQQITEKTDKKKIAEWTKNAVEKLDALVDEKTKVQVMQNCGYNCAEKNHKMIERAVARRKKYASVDDFLAAEQQKPMRGTKVEREGNTIYQYYTPKTFTRPMRCYCSLFRGLPADERFHSRSATVQKDLLRNTGKQFFKSQSRLICFNQQFPDLKNASLPFTFRTLGFHPSSPPKESGHSFFRRLQPVNL